MSIEIPKDVEAIARHNSTAMGVSIADYVSHLILGDDPEFLSDNDLTASAASLDQAMDDVRAGRTLSVTEAKRRVEENFGLRADQ